MKFLKIYNSLSLSEKQTFRLHLVYSVLDGVVLGVLALNDFVLIKSLHGTDYQIGFLFQFSVVVLLFSIFISAFFQRITNKKKLLRWAGALTRLPLLLLFFFPQTHEQLIQNSYYPYIFISIFFIYFAANPLLFPSINYILKNSYKHENFSPLFSYATSANKIVMLVVTFLFGYFLDLDNFIFIYVYPVLGILGYVSIHILSKIPIRIPETKDLQNKRFKVLESLKRLLFILKNNKAFRDFEGAFMLYGFAFMITAAVITIFLEKRLNLNYSSVAFYKNAYNTLAIVLIPFFGRLMGKIDPRKFAAITFSFFMLFLLFLAFTEYFPVYFDIWGIRIYWMLIIAYTFNGLFAATMSLSWYIGSAYFAKDSEAGDYQSIHLSLTGVRGLVAPLFGVWFLQMTSYQGVFYLASFSLLLAIVYMIYSKRKHDI